MKFSEVFDETDKLLLVYTLISKSLESPEVVDVAMNLVEECISKDRLNDKSLANILLFLISTVGSENAPEVRREVAALLAKTHDAFQKVLL